MMPFASILLAVVVGTWNGEWFPSGRAEHRANAAVEQATVREAGRMIREGLARVDPEGTNGLILCFNEIRDTETAEALCREIGRKDLSVAMISRYRRRDRYDMQQDVVMTTLPVVRANWCRWKVYKENSAPRGYAYAEILVEPTVTAAVYAVHLKSNYGQTSAAIAESDRSKRLRAIAQLVDQEKPKRKKYRMPVIVAGDFNADCWSSEFRGEKIFDVLAEAGFANCFEGVPADARITHPGHGKFANGTLDYVFFRGFTSAAAPTVIPARQLSDHNAVFADLR